MTAYEMYEALINLGIATEGEATLVAEINGMTEEAMTEILFARTGYRDFADVM